MLAGLLTAATLLAAPSPAPPTLAELDERRFEIHLGARAGLRSVDGLGLGGGAHIGLGVRLWQGLYLEAGVGEGVFASLAEPGESNPETAGGFRHLGSHDPSEPLSDEHGADPRAEPVGLAPTVDPGDPLLAGQILLGLRYEIRTPKTLRLRPSVFLGATHLHEATLEEFLDAPGKTLAGTGSFIRHRTGLQLGVGLRVPFPARWGPVAPRFSARFDLDAAYYFDALPGRLQAGLGAGLQVVF